MATTHSQHISQAIIPVAGRATRLLPATKQQPKSMLPLFFSAWNGELIVSPIIQRVFEQLFDHKLRDFYFIVGNSKRAIQDHFAPDPEYVQEVRKNARTILADELQAFYDRVSQSFLIWIDQPKPIGFGDAVLRAEALVGNDPFLLYAGDTYVFSKTDLIEQLCQAHMRGDAEATLIVQRVQDTRMYGVAEIEGKAQGILKVVRVEEKPERSTSNYAIMGLYVFNQSLMKALRSAKPGKGGELQLTDAIQHMIDGGQAVQAIEADPGDEFLDVGTPKLYWEALETSHRHSMAAEG